MIFFSHPPAAGYPVGAAAVLGSKIKLQRICVFHGLAATEPLLGHLQNLKKRKNENVQRIISS